MEERKAIPPERNGFTSCWLTLLLIISPIGAFFYFTGAIISLFNPQGDDKVTGFILYVLMGISALLLYYGIYAIIRWQRKGIYYTIISFAIQVSAPAIQDKLSAWDIGIMIWGIFATSVIAILIVRQIGEFWKYSE